MPNARDLKIKDKTRDDIIIRTSIIGIFANLILAGFKAGVGFFANSIAVILDAVNNLSDALSSVIIIIATKLAGQAPDKKHPYGHGRIEYMSQIIVAGIVLYAGIMALISSVKKIIKPETPEYNIISLVIIVFAILIKFLLGAYVKKKGNSVNSGSLIASGEDALSDAWVSFSVLVSAIIYIIFVLSLGPFVGIIIFWFIIKSGFEIIIDAINEILGQRVSSELSKKIKNIVLNFKEVYGVYDIYLNNYGPDRYNGSLHIEIKDSLKAKEIDSLSRQIADKVYNETKVIIMAIGIYSVNLGNDKANKIYVDIRKNVLENEYILQIHVFYFNQ